MIFILILVGGFFIASFYLSITMLIPLGILLLVDYIVYNFIIKKISGKYQILSKIMMVIIAIPTLALAFFSAVAIKNYWSSGSSEQKSYYEKRAEKKEKEVASGIFRFKADIRNSQVPTLSITMSKDGNMTVTPLAHTEYSFVLTKLIYVGSETVPCGFEIKVTDKRNGKSEVWQLHKNIKTFHTSGNIRFADSSDYDSLRSVISDEEGTLAVSVSDWRAKPLCLDVVK